MSHREYDAEENFMFMDNNKVKEHISYMHEVLEIFICTTCLKEDECEHSTKRERIMAYWATDAGQEALDTEEVVFTKMSLTWVPLQVGATHKEWIDEDLQVMAVYKCVLCNHVDTDGDGTVRFYPVTGFAPTPGWHPFHKDERPLCTYCTDKWEEECLEASWDSVQANDWTEKD